MTDRIDDWVNVHYEDFSQSKDEKKQGVIIRFMASPLDVPDMWRHGIVETSNGDHVAIFEFKYLAFKESARVLEKEGIRLEIGKNSRRVYRISIPLPAVTHGVNEVQVKLELAIEEIDAWEKQGALRPSHADIIQDMLRRPNIQMAF